MEHGIKKLLVDFLSDYLSHEETMKILSNHIKAKAWFRLFQGYTEKELEEILISIYSYYPSRLPSIREIKENCMEPVNLTKYRMEWNSIAEAISMSISFDEMHNLVYEKLSEEGQLALRDIGGLRTLKHNLEPQYMGVKQKNFIEDCLRYKDQLRSGLIKPLRVSLREIVEPTRIEDFPYDKSAFKKINEMLRKNNSRQGDPINNLEFGNEKANRNP